MARCVAVLCGLLVAGMFVVECRAEQRWNTGGPQPGVTVAQGTQKDKESSGAGSGPTVDIEQVLTLPPEKQKTQKTIDQEGIAVTYESCDKVGGGAIRCTLSVTSKTQDAVIFIARDFRDGTLAYDNKGKQYTPDRVLIAEEAGQSRGTERKFPAGVSTEVELYFDNVSTQATKIARLEMGIIKGGLHSGKYCCTSYKYTNIPLR